MPQFGDLFVIPWNRDSVHLSQSRSTNFFSLGFLWGTLVHLQLLVSVPLSFWISVPLPLGHCLLLPESLFLSLDLCPLFSGFLSLSFSDSLCLL